jgi:cytochrome oxidase Cu insertion factor (SCO1/SenC/PrrC family)
MRMLSAAALAAAALVVPAMRAEAQAAPAPPPLLDVGAVAPDFTLPGSTRFGLLQQPVHLSDFRGKTVVLAFFYRVRTPG